MLLSFDHIGIVVADIETGARDLSALLGELSFTRRFDDVNLDVSVQFARDRSNIVYELIAPLSPSSPVAQIMKSRNNLLNQIAYRTPSLEKASAHLRRAGCLPIGRPKPALAFEGAPVQFFMSPLGYLVELIELQSSVHEFKALV